MMRRFILGLTLSGCVMAAGCGVSASGSGVTADFEKSARDVHGYMTSDLIPSTGTARFPLTLAASRARVKILQAKAASEADHSVWLILTMVNVKSNELNGARELADTMNLSSQAMRSLKESALEVASERDTCLSEAESWLLGSSLLVASLNERPCLQQARLALAVLNKK